MREREEKDEIEDMKITLALHGARINQLENTIGTFVSAATGTFQKMNTFMDRHDATEAERLRNEARREQKFSRHNAIVTAIIAIMMLVLTAGLLYVGYLETKRAKADHVISENPVQYNASR